MVLPGMPEVRRTETLAKQAYLGHATDKGLYEGSLG